MKVGVSAWLLPPRAFGTGTFTLNHIRALKSVGINPFVIGDIGNRDFKGINMNPKDSSNKLGIISKFLVNYPLNLAKLEKNSEIYHNNLPVPASKKIPTVSVIHALLSILWGGKKVSWLDALPRKNSDRIVSVSPIITEKLEEKFGKDYVKTIPPGVWPEEYTIRKKENFVMYSGRFSKDKNIKKLLEASKDFKAPLKLTGSGMIMENKFMKLNDNTTNLGFVSRKKLTDLMGSARAFILPSKFETFGIVGVEAMASGTPLIISKEAGLSRYLRDGKDAVIVEPTKKSITEGVNRVLDDDKLSRTLIKNGLKKAEEFNWKKIIKEYVLLYEEMLD